MGVSARQIRRFVAHPGAEYGGDGGGLICRATLFEATGARGPRGAGGGVLHFAEASAGGGVGAAFFMLHHAAAGHSVYGGAICFGTLRGGDAHLSQRNKGAGEGRDVALAVFPVAPFCKTPPTPRSIAPSCWRRLQ